ncbi:MAG: hypothetical protein ACJ78I_06510 [Gemmatimonadaceae bacterium]
MKPQRFAAATLAALFILAACAENPTAPASNSSYAANSASFARGGGGISSYTFTRLDVPGATATIPSGINAGGRVVGWYVQGGVTRGFIYDAGTWTTGIVYPGATLTQLRGIGPDGTIVGNYRNATEATTVPFHGFVLTTEGVFIPVNFPGHPNNVTQRIMPDGSLIGCYHDGDTMASMHGAIYSRGVYASTPASTLGERDSISNFASMINGAAPGGRRFAGQFVDTTGTTDVGRAFLLDGDVFAPFDAPGSDFTVAWDMNPAGTIVGLFEVAHTATIRGFVLDHARVVGSAVNGTHTTITFRVVPTAGAPFDAVYTDVLGVNASGDIVGKYRETSLTGPFRGYLATRNTTE